MTEETFTDLTIVLPTLNEVGNLETLIGELGRAMPGCQVIVVDDDSNDGTPELVCKIGAGDPSVRFDSATRDASLTDSIQAGIDGATTEYVACSTLTTHTAGVLRKLYEVARKSGC